jgi:hypothetical protein
MAEDAVRSELISAIFTDNREKCRDFGKTCGMFRKQKPYRTSVLLGSGAISPNFEQGINRERNRETTFPVRTAQ